MKTGTAEQVAQWLADYDKRTPATILVGMDEWMTLAARVATSSPVMRRMSTARDPQTGAYLTPANPPPGPLGIRTGELAATVRPVKSRIVGTNSYETGLTAAPWALIHEFGGRTRPHQILPKKPGGFLRFPGKGGGTVFASRVWHPGSKIPARPYLRPGIMRSLPTGVNIINTKLQDLAVSVIG